jgi:hypothetical protein
MRTILLLLMTLMLVAAGCTSTQENVSTTNTQTAGGLSPSPAVSVATTTASPAGSTAPSINSSLPPASEGAPVDFTFNGITPDKKHYAYKIKVNTDKAISQVDIDLKFLDDKSRTTSQTTYAWQNIVKSTAQPIEKGKSYDVQEDLLDETAVRAEGKLKRVVFKDGTSWDAK